MTNDKNLLGGGNPFILWVDLETTGNTDEDEIIEVGAVVTDYELTELVAYEQVFRTTRSISDIDPIVLDMHVANGLWKDTHGKETAVERAQDAGGLLYFLGVNDCLKGGRIALAGSGVGHFDRRYIRRYWPNLENRLTFWNIDIGVVRRFLRLSGHDIPSGGVDKTHRALDDIRGHIDEARQYRNMFRAFR